MKTILRNRTAFLFDTMLMKSTQFSISDLRLKTQIYT